MFLVHSVLQLVLQYGGWCLGGSKATWRRIFEGRMATVNKKKSSGKKFQSYFAAALIYALALHSIVGRVAQLV